MINELTELDIRRGRQVANLAVDLNGLIDVDLLLSVILANARQVVMAEAGTVYLVNGGKLKIQTCQNAYLERLIPEADDLPFLGSNLEIDPTTLAGYAALNKAILTVNNTDAIDFDAPFQHLLSIDASNNYICTAIMSIPLINVNGDLLGVLQLINPIGESGQVAEFESYDEALLTFYVQSVVLALERSLILRESVLNNIRLVSLHDRTETVAHVQRIALLASTIYKNWAQRQKVPAEERDRILNILPLAAMLHDVGKAWIPDHILNKPARLDKAERATMEDHVVMGAKLYSHNRTPLDRLVRDVISDHHERWDGLGYPGTGTGPDGRVKGKKGEEISIYGRILAVADVFDALSSRKTYKEPFDESLALQIMEQESGRHFDPSVIESFLSVKPILSKIRERFPEE